MTEIIGEIGTNHNGSLKTALDIIDMCSDVGIDTVKLQIYDADDIVSPFVRTEYYGIKSDYTYWKDYINERLITPKEWLKEIVPYVKAKNIELLITAHSLENAVFCLKQGVNRLKIASMDCNYYPFVDELSKLGVPLILSTGMASRDEIVKSVEIVNKNCKDLTVMHCVSTYPTKYDEVNLEFINFLKTICSKVGLSDHSEKNDIVMMALVYGITSIEKHITLDKTQNGPDHPFALDKNGLHDLKNSVVNGIKALGSINKPMSEKEFINRAKYRRFAIADKNLPENSIFNSESYYFARSDEFFNDALDSETVKFFKGLKVKSFIEKGKTIRIKDFK